MFLPLIDFESQKLTTRKNIQLYIKIKKEQVYDRVAEAKQFHMLHEAG